MCVWMINVNLKEHFHVTDMNTVVGWMHECMNAWMHACMNEWMHDWINEWLNHWMIEWMNEWIDEWINELRNVSCHFPLNPKETQATESHLDTCLMCHRELWRTYDLPLFLFHRWNARIGLRFPIWSGDPALRIMLGLRIGRGAWAAESHHLHVDRLPFPLSLS